MHNKRTYIHGIELHIQVLVKIYIGYRSFKQLHQNSNDLIKYSYKIAYKKTTVIKVD